jgi:hypothetical protein
MRERRLLVRACLTLCQNWIAQGKPEGKKTLGSYEVYARVLGGILEAAEVAGFLDNKVKPVDRDQTSSCWPALVAAWWRERDTRLTSAGDLHNLIGQNTDLTEAFADVLGDGQSSSQKKRLGKALARNEDRVWGGFRIVRPRDVSSATCNALYKLRPENGKPAIEPPVF